jgi:4-hydroxy-tetrahydrodipicolinate synthase
MEMFQRVLPQLVFSLQNFEFWLAVEKKLLAARGIIPESSAHVRAGTRACDPAALRHAFWLNQRILETLESKGMPLNQRSAVSRQ